MSTYDSYFGDEIDFREEMGPRRNYTRSRHSSINVDDDLESKFSELESKIVALEWKNKALAVSALVIFICSLGTLIFCVIQQLSVENSSDIRNKVVKKDWKI